MEVLKFNIFFIYFKSSNCGYIVFFRINLNEWFDCFYVRGFFLEIFFDCWFFFVFFCRRLGVKKK